MGMQRSHICTFHLLVPHAVLVQGQLNLSTLYPREVVMSMLLRLVEYSKVVSLLTHVLDCYKKKKPKWQQVAKYHLATSITRLILLIQASNQIFAALLPQIGKLRVVLDSSGSLVSLYQLLTAMDPSVISIQVSHIISCEMSFYLFLVHIYTALSIKPSSSLEWE